MPEIWLRYGTTDVVLDIKFENLANQISAGFPRLTEDELNSAISRVPLTDNMLIIALSGSKAAGSIIAKLAERARERGFNFTVDVSNWWAAALRSGFGDNLAVPINRIDYRSLQDRMSKFQSTVIVSTVGYDPLFGFAGAPTALVRNLLPDSMSEAFISRKNNKPAPGVQGGPLKVATSATAGILATSIELVASDSGIAGIHIGKIDEAFAMAVSQLQSLSVIETETVKCAILSASSAAGVHSTLAGSLNSLWNNIHMVSQGGTAILLAECRDGIGGGALQMFVEDRLKQEQVQQTSYIDGLEHLIFIEELRREYGLGIVSTLPHYYASSKLGFLTYAGMKDIVDRLLERQGKNFKALVMSDADILMLKPKV